MSKLEFGTSHLKFGYNIGIVNLNNYPRQQNIFLFGVVVEKSFLVITRSQFRYKLSDKQKARYLLT